MTKICLYGLYGFLNFMISLCVVVLTKFDFTATVGHEFPKIVLGVVVLALANAYLLKDM